jgi:hypothetical protein
MGDDKNCVGFLQYVQDIHMCLSNKECYFCLSVYGKIIKGKLGCLLSMHGLQVTCCKFSL